MREKFKYLIKNSGYLLIGNFSSKILNFLLVPLYTHILSTKEYGAYDIIHTTILLLIPILSLNIIDAIMRFSIDQDYEYQKKVYSVAIKYTIIAGLLFTVLSLITNAVLIIDTLHSYIFQTIAMFWVMIISQNMVQVCRGLEKVREISISGVISTAVTVSLNILFLVILKLGINGYFLASIIAASVQSIYLAIKSKIYRYCSISLKIDKIEKEMLAYCIPLIFNTISWYINGVADRYTVTFYEGLSANGVYSVSYKIPSIMTAFQSVFIQSWQLSAVKEYNTEEGRAFVNKTYTVVQTLMIMLCSFTIILTRLLARILFQEDFYEAWICVPTLVFYVLFNTLSGTLGGIFSAVKDSKTFMKTAVIGAVTNIILNFFFIWRFGIIGAAIATAISSFIIWYLRLYYSNKYIKIDYLKNKALFQFVLLLTQTIIMTTITSYRGYFYQLVIILCLVLCNINEINSWIQVIMRKNNR